MQSTSEQYRTTLLLYAGLFYSMRNEPRGPREVLSWIYLLEWARLGGKQSEVAYG